VKNSNPVSSLLATVRRISFLSSIFSLYVLLWTYISMVRYTSLRATVYDLGLAREQLWQIYHAPLSSLSLQIIVLKPFALVLSPLSVINSPLLLFILQSAFIGGCIFPLSGIARHFSIERRETYALCSSYLLYPALAGPAWFDFHFQIFFITFFVAGYYFYIKAKYARSAAFFLLSGLRFPYLIFPLLFISIEFLFKFKKTKCNRFDGDRRLKFYLLISASLFLPVLLFQSILVPLSSQVNIIPFNAGSDIYDTLIGAVMIFLPLLFIPLLSLEWSVLTLPYIYEMFSSDKFNLIWPSLFNYQYTSGIVPFIFLGLIETLGNRENRDINLQRIRHLKAAIHRKRHSISYIILFSTALAALVFQPYGPLNNSSPNSFHFSVFDYSVKNYELFEKVAEFLPNGNQYILYQNNMPQLFPMHVQNNFISVPDIGDFGNNYSARSNSFPVYNGHRWLTEHFDYAIADTSSRWFYLGYPSMYDIVRQMYSSGCYGILAEAGSFFVLERGFYGYPKLFIPYNHTFAPNAFFTQAGSRQANSLEVSDLNSDEIGWYGPYAFLMPGKYRAYEFIYSQSGNVSFTLQVVSNFGHSIIAERNISESSPEENPVPITLNFTITNLTANVEFRMVSSHVRGAVYLLKVQIVQENF